MTDPVRRTTTTTARRPSQQQWEKAPEMSKVSDGNAVLKRNQYGDSVKEMQGILKQGGFLPKHGADGYFGEETEGALKKWQSSLGLEPTGQLDAKTWKALRAHQASTPDLPTGATSRTPIEEVRARDFAKAAGRTFEARDRWADGVRDSHEERTKLIGDARGKLDAIEKYANTQTDPALRQQLNDTISRLRGAYESLEWKYFNGGTLRRDAETAKALEGRIAELVRKS